MNEVREYLEARYFSASEAFWRMVAFRLQEQDPKVFRLAVHLAGQHNVTFTDGAVLQAVAAACGTSNLLAFFKLCEEDPDARDLLYTEVCKHYTWCTRTKVRRAAAATALFCSAL